MEAGKVRYIITADTDEFYVQLNQADKAVERFSDNLNRNSSKAGQNIGKGFVDGSSQAVSAIRKLASESVEAFSQVSKAIGNIAWGTFTTAAGAAATSLTSMISGGLSDTDFLERAQVQMIGLTHSVEQGNKAFAAAVQYYKNNPFDRFTTTTAVKNLLQFGATVEQVPELLDKLGKVSLSTSASLDELAMIYQRTIANGKVGLDDIYTLVNRGADIWGAFAKATGKTADQIRVETSKGGVAIEDFIKAFDYLVDDKAMEMFNNTFSRQMDRFKGRLSNLRAYLIGYGTDMQTGLNIYEDGLYRAVTKLYKTFADVMDSDIGKGIYNSLTKLGKILAPFVDKVSSYVEPALRAFGKALEYVTDHSELLIPVLGGALVMFGNFGSTIPGLSGVLKNFTTGFQQLSSIIKSTNFSIFTKGLIVLAGLGIWKAFKEGWLTDSLKSIMSSIQRLGAVLAPVIKQIMQIMSEVGGRVVTVMLQSLATILEALADVLEKIPTDVLVSLALGIVGLTTAMKGLNTVTGVVDKFKAGGDIIGGISNIFTKQKTTSLKDVVTELKDLKTNISGMSVTAKEVTISAQSAGKELTKGQQAMKTMRSGLLNLVVLAGAIVALAAALWAVQKLVPEDFGMLAAKMGMIGAAVFEMGTLAAISAKLKIKISDITPLIGIAGVIAAVGAALWVVNQTIPDDFGNLIPKIIFVGAVTGAIELLAAGLSKLNIGDVSKGLIAMLGVAGDLVAVSIALALVQAVIPDDFGTLINKLGLLAGVIAAMGVLAAVGGKLIKYIGPGLLAIAGIAADIALIAAAIGFADSKIPADFGGLIGKIGIMGAVILEFGVLAAGIGGLMATGIGALIMGAGLAGILGIVAGVMAVAEAIRQLNEKVPLNMEEVTIKLENIKKALAIMADNQFGGMLQNFVTAVNVTLLGQVATVYAKVAEALQVIQGVELDAGLIKRKINLIKSCLDLVVSQDEGSVGDAFKTTIKNFLQVADTYAAAQVVGIYHDIAKKLNELQSIELFRDTIREKIKIIKECIDTVASIQDGTVWDAIQNTCKQWLNTLDVAAAAQVIGTYTNIADELTKIQSVDLNQDAIKSKVEFIKQCVEIVSTQEDGGVWDAIQNTCKQWLNTIDVENAQKVIGTYVEIADDLMKIQDAEIDAEVIIKKVELIKKCIDIVAAKNDKSIWVALTDTCKGFLNTIDTDNASKVVKTYKTIADDLMDIQNIFLVPFVVKEKVELIKNVIDTVASTQTGEGSLWESINKTCQSFLNTVQTENAAKVVAIYGSICDALKAIQDLDVDVEKVQEKIKKITEIVSVVTDTGENSLFSMWINAAKSNLSVEMKENGAKIIEIYAGMLDMLNEIKNNAPDDADTEEINGRLKNLNSAMQTVLDMKNGGLFQNIGAFFGGGTISVDDVDKIKELLEHLKNVAQAVIDIPDLNNQTYRVERVKDVVSAVKEIKTDGKLDKIKEYIGKVSQVVDYFATIGGNVERMVDMGEQNSPMRAKISHMKSAISEIGSLGGHDGIDWKVTDTEKIKNITDRMKEIGDKVVSFPDITQEHINNIKNMVTAIGEAGKLWGQEGMDWKPKDLEKIVAFIEKYEILAPKIVGLPEVTDSHIDNIKQIIAAVGWAGKLWGQEGMSWKPSDLEKIEGFINRYETMVPKIVAFPEVTDNHISNIKKILIAIAFAAQIWGNTGMDWKPSDLEKIEGFIDKYETMVPKMVAFPEVTDEHIENIKRIVTAIGEAGKLWGQEGMDYKESDTETISKIVDHMVKISNTIPNIKRIEDEQIESIGRIQAAIGIIGEIQSKNDIYDVSEIVDESVKIIDKLKGFADKIVILPSLAATEGGDPVGNMILIRDTLYEAGQINEVPNLQNKVDVVSLTTKILDGLITFATKVLVVPNIPEQSRNDVQSVLDAMWTSIGVNEGVGDLQRKRTIVEQSTKIVQELQKFATEINGIPAVGGDLFDIVTRLVTTINMSISKLTTQLNVSAGQFTEYGRKIADNLLSGFNGAEIPLKFKSVAQSLPGTISSVGPSIAVAGRTLGQKALEGIYGVNLYNEFYKVGVNAGQGFIDGMNAQKGAVRTTADTLGNIAATAIKNVLKIHSPSKVMFGLGEFTTEGLAEGILSNADMIRDAAEEIASILDEPFDELKDKNLTISGIKGDPRESGIQGNRSNTINMTNNIYSQFDMSQMGRDIMWNMNRYQ